MTVDLRLAAPVAAAWIAVGILIAVPPALVGAAIGAWAAAVAVGCDVVLSGRRGSIAVPVAVALAASALLLTIAAVDAPQRQPRDLLDAAHAGRFVTATAVTTETLYPGRGPYSATLTSVSVGLRSIDCHLPVTVFGEPPKGPSATVGIG